MKTFAPKYYKKFQCIADKCKHSCCVGWEIDIDDDTLEYYESINSDFGNKLRENIIEQDGCKCFKLTKDERCPLLNDNNLCDIILNLGEDALCQICSDHPRFRNFYSDRIEIGLGLCCEETARLILTDSEKMSLVEIDNDFDNINCEELDFFSWRDNVFKYFSDESISTTERMSIKSEEICSKQLLKKYLSLEILDEKWKVLLEELIECFDNMIVITIPQEFDICFEQLLMYFSYRHLSLLLDGKDKENLLSFVKMSTSVIYTLCQLHISKYNTLDIEDIIEYSRMYSSEIEYSQENLDSLI